VIDNRLQHRHLLVRCPDDDPPDPHHCRDRTPRTQCDTNPAGPATDSPALIASDLHPSGMRTSIRPASSRPPNRPCTSQSSLGVRHVLPVLVALLLGMSAPLVQAQPASSGTLEFGPDPGGALNFDLFGGLGRQSVSLDDSDTDLVGTSSSRLRIGTATFPWMRKFASGEPGGAVSQR